MRPSRDVAAAAPQVSCVCPAKNHDTAVWPVVRLCLRDACRRFHGVGERSGRATFSRTNHPDCAGHAGPHGGARLDVRRPTARAPRSGTCVTCHNDRLKTANLSLEKLDLITRVGDHPELWEKVIRKLRAGVMPPPEVKPRPAARRSTRGLQRLARRARSIARRHRQCDILAAVVLHRLNRTEYANAIRDLLDLRD